MSTTSFEEDLIDARGVAQVKLLEALDAATKRLTESTEIESVVGIREAAETITAIDIALKRLR